MNSALMMGSRSTQPPVPGLTIEAVDTKFGNGANTHALTGVPAGALLVISAGGQFQQGDATVTSSPSLTWTKRADASTPQSPNAEIWTADFPAGGAINVTTNFGAGRVQTSVCYVMTGEDTIIGVGAVGLGQSTADVTIETGRTNSIIVCSTYNWNAPDAGAGGVNTVYRNGQATATQRLYYRDAAAGTFWHYTYQAQNIQQYNVGYSSPGDVDLGTSTAVFEIRSLTGTGPTPDTTDPVMGTVTVGTVTHNTVNLSWSPATDNVGVTGYAVLSGTTNPPTAVVANISGTTHQVTGLAPETTYFFIVRARDAAGNTDDSTVVSATTSATPADTIAPSAPTGLVISNLTSASATLTWNTSTDTGGSGMQDYRVYRNTTNPPTTVIATVTHPTNTFNMTGLSPSTTYFVKVEARDAALNATSSTVLSFTTPVTTDTTPPTWTGTVLTAGTTTSSTAPLTWTAATDLNGINAYEIYQGNPTGTFIASVSGSTLSYTVTGLSANTSYIFYVRAKDPAGNGTNSNTVNPTTSSLVTCSGGSGTALTFSPLTVDYSRYWGGWEFWGTGEGAVSMPAPTMHDYTRFSWCDMEGNVAGDWKFKQPGSKFRSFLDNAVAGRRLMSWGLITSYPYLTANDSYFASIQPDGSSARATIPQYLVNLMAAEGKPIWKSNTGNHWTPNYNSTQYIARLNTLYAEINNWLNTTNSAAGVPYKRAMGCIDIRGFGSWGECHQNGTVDNNTFENPNNWDGGNYVQMFSDGSAGATDTNPTHQGSFPSFTRLKEIIDAHKTNFPDVQLVCMVAMLEANFNSFGTIYGTGWNNTLMHQKIGRYILDNGNAFGPIGWRRDQWGQSDSYYLSPAATNGALVTGVSATNINERWKYAPVTGEPPGGGYNMSTLPSECNLLHATMVGNSNYGGGQSVDGDAVRAASKANGAIIRPTGGCVILNSTNLIITIDWNNFGLNEIFNHWDLFFELRNSGGTLAWTSPVKSAYDPFKKLPNTNHTIQDTYARPTGPLITAGQTYTLSMRFQDPGGYMLPLQLGINGRQEPSGRYNLTTLNF